MLVTLTSQGAAVERIELADPRYYDLEDKSAYIGHLDLILTPSEETFSGLQVTVVGAGTPAAKGGIQVGDIVTELDGKPVASPEEWTRGLAKFKPGDSIPVTILRRDVQGAAVASTFNKKTLNLFATPRPMEVIRPESGTEGEHPYSYLLSVQQLGHRAVPYDQVELAKLPSLREGFWYAEQIERDGQQVIEFRFPIGSADFQAQGLQGAMEVVKRFWFRPRNRVNDNPEDTASAQGDRAYADTAVSHFDFEVEFKNLSQHNLEVAYRLDGPTGLPLEGWWYAYKTHPTSWSGAGMRDLVYRTQGQPHQMITNPVITEKMKDEPQNPDFPIVASGSREPLDYIGVDAQYFSSPLLPAIDDQGKLTSILVGRVVGTGIPPVDTVRSSRTDVTFRMESTPLLIAPGKNVLHPYRIFAGPKRPRLLESYGLEETIVYGWFKRPAVALGWLLHKLHSLVGNYGIAIVLLTLIVRAVMFLLLGRKQALNARKMQELTPEIKKIKEKFPNDLEKQTAAHQELLRKHNVNPVAGCLPVFLQVPIFMGLYRALSVDIELRQQPLIQGIGWCSNLAAPDMLYRWDHLLPKFLAGYTGYLGPYLNLLPLVSVCLFVVHQQMYTPPPTDEQQ